LWWDEDTLCIQTEDGIVLQFKGAFITDVHHQYDNENAVQIETVSFSYDKK
jgi:type VI protein secretion system component Hcp